MTKTAAQLAAEIAKLTEAHEIMVKEAEKKKAEDAAQIKALKKTGEKLLKEAEDLKAKAEAARNEAKKQRDKKAEEQQKGMRALLKASPHHWVQVFNSGMDDGTDFSFTYEGLLFRLISGKPVFLSEILINHLKKCRRPKAKLRQGEAGQAVKVEGFHYNFNVVNCEKPEPVKATG